MEWFGLHEARHSFSTYLDHAGISETRADRYMGHSNSSVGRYRHLLPGQMADDAKRVDAYLAEPWAAWSFRSRSPGSLPRARPVALARSWAGCQLALYSMTLNA